MVGEYATEEITANDMDKPMEEESMIINLTQGMPLNKSEKVSGTGVRKSVHRSSQI